MIVLKDCLEGGGVRKVLYMNEFLVNVVPNCNQNQRFVNLH